MGSTLGLYLIRNFIVEIPDSILESARIDGASEYRIFWVIIMPNIRPAWLTVALLSVQSLWNMGSSNYIYSENLKSLNYALSQIVSVGISRAGVAAAVSVLMLIVPVAFFLFSQSNVMETMTHSGMKE
jgi:ABC-type glycerol-3-phosphate transport system permease component